MFGGRSPTHPSFAVLTLLSGISEVPNMSIPKSIMLFTAFSSLFISALSISLSSVSFDRCFPKPVVGETVNREKHCLRMVVYRTNYLGLFIGIILFRALFSEHLILVSTTEQ